MTDMNGKQACSVSSPSGAGRVLWGYYPALNELAQIFGKRVEIPERSGIVKVIGHTFFGITHVTGCELFQAARSDSEDMRQQSCEHET